LVPDEGDKQDEVSRDLRNRDFRFALLSRSDLHRADLTEADLGGAQMFQTRLDKAKLEHAQLQGADLQLARLQGADLIGAQLQGANLIFAELQGAELGFSQLQGAALGFAQLQGANLQSAQLQGADLRGAQLLGANLAEAELQGADLILARLQGANLAEAELQGADLLNANVWLVKFPSRLVNQSPAPLGLADLKMSPPAAEAKAEIRHVLQTEIADGKLLERLLDRLNPILRDDPPHWDDEESWNRYVSKAKEKELPPDELARFYADLACGDPWGHIANGMVRNLLRDLEWKATYPVLNVPAKGYAKPLASALLNDNCKGGTALTDEARAMLEGLVSEAE
jgi:uncharacterized protein YjbI with pentapeptide repeats